MANLAPLLIAAGAAAVIFGKKKKRRKKAVAEAPPGLPPPLPGEEEEDFEEGEEELEPPGLPPGEEPGEPSFQEGVIEPPTPGKSVASGVERHYTGAYPWKIIFTDQGDYAAHYYPMGHRGPHEQVARGDSTDAAISEFKFWATNEDRKKRGLSPFLKVRAVAATPGAESQDSPEDQGDIGGLGGG